MASNSSTTPELVDVDKKVFFFDSRPSEASLTVSSLSDGRTAIRIRCGNKMTYTITPETFFLARGEKMTVKIAKNQGGRERDRLLIEVAPCEQSDEDATKVIKNAKDQKQDYRVVIRVPDCKPKLCGGGCDLD